MYTMNLGQNRPFLLGSPTAPTYLSPNFVPPSVIIQWDQFILLHTDEYNTFKNYLILQYQFPFNKYTI